MQLQLRLSVQMPYTIFSIPNQIAQTGSAASNGSSSYFLLGRDQSILSTSVPKIYFCPQDSGMKIDCGYMILHSFSFPSVKP